MFSRESDASKVALFHLVNYLKQQDFLLVDCQLSNDHLTSLGARDISRDQFLDVLEQHVTDPQGNIWQPKALTTSND